MSNLTDSQSVDILKAIHSTPGYFSFAQPFVPFNINERIKQNPEYLSSVVSKNILSQEKSEQSNMDTDNELDWEGVMRTWLPIVASLCIDSKVWGQSLSVQKSIRTNYLRQFIPKLCEKLCKRYPGNKEVIESAFKDPDYFMAAVEEMLIQSKAKDGKEPKEIMEEAGGFPLKAIVEREMLIKLRAKLGPDVQTLRIYSKQKPVTFLFVTVNKDPVWNAKQITQGLLDIVNYPCLFPKLELGAQQQQAVDRDQAMSDAKKMFLDSAKFLTDFRAQYFERCASTRTNESDSESVDSGSVDNESVESVLKNQLGNQDASRFGILANRMFDNMQRIVLDSPLAHSFCQDMSDVPKRKGGLVNRVRQWLNELRLFFLSYNSSNPKAEQEAIVKHRDSITLAPPGAN